MNPPLRLSEVDESITRSSRRSSSVAYNPLKVVRLIVGFEGEKKLSKFPSASVNNI